MDRVDLEARVLRDVLEHAGDLEVARDALEIVVIVRPTTCSVPKRLIASLSERIVVWAAGVPVPSTIGRFTTFEIVIGDEIVLGRRSLAVLDDTGASAAHRRRQRPAGNPS